jgi:hypothetical protein
MILRATYKWLFVELGTIAERRREHVISATCSKVIANVWISRV